MKLPPTASRIFILFFGVASGALATYCFSPGAVQSLRRATATQSQKVSRHIDQPQVSVDELSVLGRTLRQPTFKLPDNERNLLITLTEASRNPAATLEFAAGLPYSNYIGAHFSMAVRALAEIDPAAAVDLIRKYDMHTMYGAIMWRALGEVTQDLPSADRKALWEATKSPFSQSALARTWQVTAPDETWKWVMEALPPESNAEPEALFTMQLVWKDYILQDTSKAIELLGSELENVNVSKLLPHLWRDLRKDSARLAEAREGVSKWSNEEARQRVLAVLDAF